MSGSIASVSDDPGIFEGEGTIVGLGLGTDVALGETKDSAVIFAVVTEVARAEATTVGFAETVD